MSEGNVCSGWMLLILLLCSLHHVIHTKRWQLFKRRHWLLVCFVSLPMVLCWKMAKKLFKPFAALCGALARGWEFFCALWRFRKWCLLTAEMCRQLQLDMDSDTRGLSHGMVESKDTKEPVSYISCKVFVCSRVVWVWFGSLQLRSTQLVIRQRLIMSGDVELNPGPLNQGNFLASSSNFTLEFMSFA